MMKELIFSVLFVFGAIDGLTAFGQSPLVVTGGVPSYINSVGIEEDDVKYMEHEFVVRIPALSGSVSVKMGDFSGDTAYLNRSFPLIPQRFADSTWVASMSGGGWQIGLGRFIGLDGIHVEVRDASDNVIGVGSWARP